MSDDSAIAVWIIDHAPIQGGGQGFALRLARADGSARIICPPGSELARRAAAAGVEVTSAEFPPLASPAMVGGVLALRRLLATAAPGTVVVANDPRTQAYAWAATRLMRRHPPVVLLAHERDSASRPSARFVYRRFGTVLAVGSQTAAVYGSRAINNFLLEAPAAAPPPPGDGRLGVLARMIPEKGIFEVIEELVTDADAWSSLMIGAAPEDADYVAEVRRRLAALQVDHRVQLLGHVDDVPGFLAGIDVLVVPSTGSEAQPTVILEALAHGRPVVVRRPLWSADYEGLPVFPYDGAADLPAALARAVAAIVPPWSDLEARFGPAQALDGVAQAAASTRS